jgi:hypothetical protein
MLGELRDRAVDELDCRPEAFGHPRLAAAVRELCDRWQLGVTHLTEDGTELADGLARTVATYEAADAAAHRVLVDAAAALHVPAAADASRMVGAADASLEVR